MWTTFSHAHSPWRAKALALVVGVLTPWCMAQPAASESAAREQPAAIQSGTTAEGHLGPRPLSEAERKAVEMAVAFFDAGLDSWWPWLSAESPWHPLGRAAALDELHVRLVSPAHATWTLQTPAKHYGENVAIFSVTFPSGFTDTLMLELNDALELVRVRTLVDPPEGPQESLAPLRRLREAIAEGRTDLLPGIFRTRPDEGPLADVGRLWEAQYSIETFDLDRGAQLIREVTKGRSTPPLPLAATLRAWLSFTQMDSLEMAIGFDRALDQGYDHDGLRLESLEIQRALGFLDERGLQHLGAMGSREADVYYLLARAAAFYEDDDAEALFRIAWELEPRERRRLFADPVLATFSARPSIFRLLDLDSDPEPVVIPAGDRNPLPYPTGTSLSSRGRFLTIGVGDGTIHVPNGLELAPAETPGEDAASAQRRRDDALLADLDDLVAMARVPASLTNLRLRHQLETAAEALVERERWDDLLRLTEGFADRILEAGADLGSYRAIALAEKGDDMAAGRVLVDLANHLEDTEGYHVAPLVLLANLCADRGKYDAALRFLHKAASIVPNGLFEQRIHQIELDRSIARSERFYESPHFTIRYTEALIEEQALKVSRELERERERLRAWIPVRSSRKVEVHLFPHDAFADAYGANTLGLFDGKMRIPFLDTYAVQVVLTGVLSHELAHAMITDYTGDEASVPSWFHEGLAQLVEMERGFRYPEPDAHDRHFALSVIEEAIDAHGGSELVDLAYRESVWILYFIQDRFGISGIRSALTHYAMGKETEQVLADAFGVTKEEFYAARDRWYETDAQRIIAAKEAAEKELEMKQALADSHVRTTDGRELPKARIKKSVRPDTEEFDKEVDAWVDSLFDWHRYYTAAVREGKKSLRLVVGNYRGHSSVPLGDACRKLAEESRKVLTDPKVFDSPDPIVKTTLSKTYQHFRLAATACTQGQTARVQHELDEAEGYLKRAAERLALFGLSP